MLSRQIQILLLISCLFLCHKISLAQTDVNPSYFDSEITERKFDEGRWKKIVDQLEYTQDGVRQEKKKDTSFDDLVVDQDDDAVENNQEWVESTPNSNSSFWALFFKILIISATVIIVAVIITNLMRSGEITKKSQLKSKVKTVTKTKLKNIETKIHETDLDRLIKEALSQKEYALAIRLYYLAAIKELSLNKLIKWKKDKTNRDYLHEINQMPISKPFREATNIFERVWYGDGKLNESDFQILKPKFQALVAAAKKRPTE